MAMRFALRTARATCANDSALESTWSGTAAEWCANGGSGCCWCSCDRLPNERTGSDMASRRVVAKGSDGGGTSSRRWSPYSSLEAVTNERNARRVVCAGGGGEKLAQHATIGDLRAKLR